MSKVACRMAYLLDVQQSLKKVDVVVLEVAGRKMDDNTIRRKCHPVAQQAASTRARRATAEALAQASDDLELQIDTGKVKTKTGWRDVKVAVFKRREWSEQTTATAWEERDLPAPTGRSVIAAVEEAKDFGPRCTVEDQWLDLTNPEQ